MRQGPRNQPDPLNGEELRDFRQLAELSIPRLAKLSRISKWTIRDYESREEHRFERTMRPRTARRLMEALEGALNKSAERRTKAVELIRQKLNGDAPAPSPARVAGEEKA